MISLATHRLAFFFQAAEWNHQHYPSKSKVTGFASFSQLLLGNANADADSSTGFLCGRKDTKLAQALFQKLWGRRELPFLSKTPTGVSEPSDTLQPQSQYEKWTFPISGYCLHTNHHLFFYFQPGWGLDSHQSFALPIYFWLLGIWDCCQVQACTAYKLHLLHQWRCKFPEPQLMGLGSYKGLQPS